ncbi:MAG: MBL fold metallo-hydrolase [Deltaproteobacteria bacterium]|nr:MBL fold metallo-hydrolase [Deltaproteobacteria bacterium]
MRRIWSLEGNRQRLDGGAMFGNAPRALWERWIPPDALGRIELACRCLLLEDAGRFTLFETGIGSFFAPQLRERFGVEDARHLLLDALAHVGPGHEGIDAVVLSHLHFDHAGGLLMAFEEGSELRLLFPRARFVVSEAAFARAESPHERDRASYIPELPRLLRESGRLELVGADGVAAATPGVRYHFSDGHTPGLMLGELDSSDGPIVFAADAIPGVPWVHAPITMGYDRYPERLIDEKRALLEGLLERRGRLFFTHDRTTALGRVARDARGRFQVEDVLSDVVGLAI